MDPGYSTGLSDSLQGAATKQADSSLYLHRDREQVDLSRGGGVVTQASNKSDSIDDGFINNIFLVSKGRDKWRLILNLKALNLYTEHHTSKWKVFAV